MGGREEEEGCINTHAQSDVEQRKGRVLQREQQVHVPESGVEAGG